MDKREKTVSVVTVWGAVSNLGLSVFKLFAGIVGHSAAMVADAIHSFSDLISDVIVLVMVKVSSRKLDDRHRYGHGKFETLATVAVSIMLLVIGAKLMLDSVAKILSVIGGAVLPPPGSIALWAALVSIAVKEALYQWTARTGRKVNSQVMIANAWHHRSDALSSVGSAFGIGGAMLLGGRWAILDPLACCVISIVIIIMAVRISIPAFDELTDAALPAETEAEILSTLQSVDGVGNIHALKTRRNGPVVIIQAHIVVDPRMSVADAHEITSVGEERLHGKFGAEAQITLHIEPDVNAA